jgi:RNA polymerase II-associated factor 1
MPFVTSRSSQHHARNVSWLRRTEYISTETTRFQPQTIDKAEARVGFNVKRRLQVRLLASVRFLCPLRLGL